MQDVLGRLHDLQVLIDRARDVQASLTPPDITAWRELDRLVVALEEDCRRLHGRYMHDRDALAALCRPSARASRTRTSEVRSQEIRSANGQCLEVAVERVTELYLIRHGVAEERGEAWPDDSKRPLTAGRHVEAAQVRARAGRGSVSSST